MSRTLPVDAPDTALRSRAGPGSPPRVGVIYNRRSHGNQGQDFDPVAFPHVAVAQPGDLASIRPALESFAAAGIDLLVINGGDGTVRDVLTCGQPVFGHGWPALAVLPKGKTNALNVDLGAPANWTLADAMAAYAGGKRRLRRPLRVAPADGGAAQLGFILGGGAYSTGIRAGQDAHRLGAFNSLAVAVTGVWGVLQGLLGSNANRWRRGTEMRLLMGEQRSELGHCEGTDNSRRSIFLATTLERLPMGVKLFAPGPGLIKLVVLDRPRRRVLMVLPAILAGYVPRWVARSGFHQVDIDAFELDIAEPYILDGEAYPAGSYRIEGGPELSFVVP